VEATLQKNIRNSELVVDKEKRTFLTYTASGLAPCTLEETEDSVNFIFDTNGDSAEVVLKKPKWEQFRFLINCASLEHLSQEYDFAMSLDNLIADINLMPQVLLRDVKTPEGTDFLQCYKALIGSVLLRKYKYENYINGGNDLYKKNKLLTELSGLETVEDVQNRLLEAYHALLKETEATQKLVSKNSVIFSRIAIPVLAVALAVALFFGGRMLFIEIPFNNSVISASIAYIHGDHLTVQRELRNYSVERLSVETRHFLARSYVSTEAMAPSQINTILTGLARLTDPMTFDYWIHLGRLNFAEAIDIAQRRGDDELLLFAYVKQDAFVRNDMSLPGDERTALLSYLVTHIERLTREREAAAGDGR